MDSKILSDVACGVFRLRKDDPHMFNSTVVDVHDDDYTTLTTVEVRSGTIVVHCLATLEAAEDEDGDEDGDESETEEGADDEETAKEEVEEEEEESETPEGKSYTLSSGNSVTVRAMAVRLVPIGMETAEGVYQVQMMKAAG